MLKLLFSIITFPITAFLLLKSTLTYQMTITEQTWLIEYRDQSVTVRQSIDNEAQLLAFQELIALSHSLIHSIIFQASLIGLFILTIIIFCIVKPRLVIHPATLIFFLASVVFTIHIYQQLAVLRIHTENLRYYFLLFTT
ncbi:MAG: hypothetical protein ABS949_05200 [Solibacillus sp.]